LEVSRALVRQRHTIVGPNPGLKVYSPDGKFRRRVPNEPFDFHGFIIDKEAAGEFTYATRLAAVATGRALIFPVVRLLTWKAADAKDRQERITFEASMAKLA
jgi:hypothetical protein